MTVENFRALHQDRPDDDALVLPGPWDAASARAFADAGFPALATPSAGVAASLGYEDGQTPTDEMFTAITRITRSVDVPVSADVEGGYGLPPKELVARILDSGAIGCNLEDSDSATKSLNDARRHADWLAEVRAAAGDRLFINARVDSFLRGVSDPAEAITRARLYVAAGADCVYPFAVPPEQLPLLRKEIEGPINVAPRPGGPAVAELARLGATRITFGPFLQQKAVAAARKVAETLRRN
ncbi:isocitrate lyase/phosphoenolpyruvate mutase family protein [Streptomyces lunaelactis]|uniref:isocitrate lyase/PEP mutase family protein n=1 Tax=Streptomyces lunaelactis TaxID=1535768 RepID=UPI0015847555|nr:isocitrate lyase/phosphoenolpyruvate mutase family protein [Streptomyces lunaelactis]NUK10865.1 isocitrate lyase/phosphoenolpyruvate mutase family protein [Streptomyces lunaelactis]NUK35443.1 isocitrate lyase/phosphoenolpyruvate mutase family protein [Streptomyces lunaelactis]NUK61089.1 isocitrate lyase/phosphoenolpyruvate mutase family protein [Streptomyces lunaelactis]NUK95562.1 isocitrate lyase/phosphoenolpyruvate mutase family protein [Streptomyces lunaelactis]NUL11765.1 isocitrate lyas